MPRPARIQFAGANYQAADTGAGLDLELKVQRAAGILARALRISIEDGLYHATE